MPGCVLQDGAVRIFLNTHGKNDAEISEELRDFWHYLENTTDRCAECAASKRSKRIHERVCKVKNSEEMRVKYMQAWEEKYYLKQEAREEGARNKLWEQVEKKLQKGKSIEEIADALEESVEVIRELIAEIEDTAKEE